jgi:hypothetical protein
MSFDLFDPTAAPSAASVPLASRPARPDGLRLGLVENTKHNAEPLLRRLAQRLSERHGITVTHVDRKRSPSHEVTETALGELKRKADVVVSGVGD